MRVSRYFTNCVSCGLRSISDSFCLSVFPSHACFHIAFHIYRGAGQTCVSKTCARSAPLSAPAQHRTHACPMVRTPASVHPQRPHPSGPARHCTHVDGQNTHTPGRCSKHRPQCACSAPHTRLPHPLSTAHTPARWSEPPLSVHLLSTAKAFQMVRTPTDGQNTQPGAPDGQNTRTRLPNGQKTDGKGARLHCLEPARLRSGGSLFEGSPPF